MRVRLSSGQRRLTEQCWRREHGLVCAQAESLWLHLPIIKELASMCHEVFQGGSVQYAYTTIPTYPRSAVRPSSPEVNPIHGRQIGSNYPAVHVK
jgi:spermidine synthase